MFALIENAKTILEIYLGKSSFFFFFCSVKFPSDTFESQFWERDKILKLEGSSAITYTNYQVAYSSQVGTW